MFRGSSIALLAALAALPASIAAAPSVSRAAAPAEAPPAAVATPTLDGVRVRADGDRTRVEIDVAGDVAPELGILTDHRLVVDLPGVASRLRTSEIAADGAHLRRVRIGRHVTPPKTRLVLDLRGPEPYALEKTPGGFVIALGRAPGLGAAEPLAGAPAEPAPATEPAAGSEAGASPPPEPAAGSEAGASPPPEPAAGAPASLPPAEEPAAEAARRPATVDPGESGTGEWFGSDAPPAPGAPAAEADDAPAAPEPAAGETAAAPPSGQAETETPPMANAMEADRLAPGGLVSIDFRSADVRSVIDLVAAVGGYDVVFAPGVEGKVTVQIVDRPWEEALGTILKQQHLRATHQDDWIEISPAQTPLDARRSTRP